MFDDNVKMLDVDRVNVLVEIFGFEILTFFFLRIDRFTQLGLCRNAGTSLRSTFELCRSWLVFSTYETPEYMGGWQR